MFVYLIAATALAACAAWADWLSGHIPNKLTIGGLALAIVAHAARGGSVGGLRGGAVAAGLAVLGALLCALVPLLMFHKGAMGGGDVKTFAALGALLHPLGGLQAETYSFVAAALFVTGKLVAEGSLGRTLGGTIALAANPFRAEADRKTAPEACKTWFRLGPAIFAGTAATLLVHAYDWRVR